MNCERCAVFDRRSGWTSTPSAQLVRNPPHWCYICTVSDFPTSCSLDLIRPNTLQSIFLTYTPATLSNKLQKADQNFVHLLPESWPEKSRGQKFPTNRLNSWGRISKSWPKKFSKSKGGATLSNPYYAYYATFGPGVLVHLLGFSKNEFCPGVLVTCLGFANFQNFRSFSGNESDPVGSLEVVTSGSYSIFLQPPFWIMVLVSYSSTWFVEITSFMLLLYRFQTSRPVAHFVRVDMNVVGTINELANCVL